MERKQRIRGRAIVLGDDLVKALGFNSARTFQLARQQGTLQLRLYPIPGQSRGVYAFADDIEAWKKAKSTASSTQLHR